MHRHISYRDRSREKRRKLKKGTVAARTRNDTNTTCAKWLGRTLLDIWPIYTPLVMAYATQCVAPIVVPGKKVESTLTKAMAVDLTASLGA